MRFGLREDPFTTLRVVLEPAGELTPQAVRREVRARLLGELMAACQESPTYLDHVEVELTEDNYRALYIPERFAHGYQTLRDNTDTSYQVGEFYTPSAESGLRCSDPRLKLTWPLPATAMSDKDRTWKLLDEIEPELRQRMQGRSFAGAER